MKNCYNKKLLIPFNTIEGQGKLQRLPQLFFEANAIFDLGILTIVRNNLKTISFVQSNSLSHLFACFEYTF